MDSTGFRLTKVGTILLGTKSAANAIPELSENAARGVSLPNAYELERSL